MSLGPESTPTNIAKSSVPVVFSPVCRSDSEKFDSNVNIPLLNVAYMPHKRKFIFLELLNAKTPYDQTDVLMRDSEKACEKLFEAIEKYLKYEYIY